MTCEISNVLDIAILPFIDKLNLLQQPISWWILARAPLEMSSSRRPSCPIRNPRIFILSTIVKPSSSISGASTGSLGPINIIHVFSKLHFSPLITEKSCNMDFRATRTARFCLQETLVSSANASVFPEPFLTSLLIFASSIKCSNGLGTFCSGRIGSILVSNSSLIKQICSPILY